MSALAFYPRGPFQRSYLTVSELHAYDMEVFLNLGTSDMFVGTFKARKGEKGCDVA